MEASAKERMNKIVSRVEFEDFNFMLRCDGNGSPYLQIEADEYDNDTGMIAPQKSRKWMLSPHMTDGEIVQTCLKAVLTYFEHEVRERFKVDGQAIYGPHLDVDSLVKAMKNGKLKPKKRN